MVTANIHEAKTHLSRLVQRALAGEEVVIARNGTPAVRLVPVATEGGRRRLGLLAGRIWIADDFDAPLSEPLLESFGLAPPASP